MRADLPDWLWERLARQHGEEEALRIAQGLLNPAPLDLRVNLARTEREAAQAQLAADGIEVEGDAVFARGPARSPASRRSTATRCSPKG